LDDLEMEGEGGKKKELTDASKRKRTRRRAERE